jgi:DNA-binding CsgD family transcriptional regulator
MVLQSEAQSGRSRRPTIVANEPLVLFTPQEWGTVARLLGLTPRQLNVAELLCAECSQRDMARRLGLSMDTVRTHLRALYARLHVQSRVGVVVRLVLAQRELSDAARVEPLLDMDRAPVFGARAEDAIGRGGPGLV